MKEDRGGEECKKTYERPELRVITLAADEVLAVGCKTAASGTASGGGPPCMIRNCSGAGS